ncbi:MAG TPA: IPT/TIG domain-containing protein [Bryobacteraceae bacterium]|nr:IPT/TIG domain-containing protein [Bryobacteraceae bacterium]
MRLSLMTPLLVVTAIVLYAQQTMPRMTSVEPDSAKAGDILTVSGEHLDKGEVVELYLTDGKKDTKCQITEQSPTALKFKVSDKITAGRFALMVMTGGKDPKLIEQPVKVNIE